MARNVNILGCIRVHMSGACEDITIINSSGYTGNASMNGWTIINDARYIPNNFDTSTGSVPKTVDGDYTIYLADCSSADNTFIWDVFSMRGCSVTIKCVAAGHNIIITNTSVTGNFEFSAVPQTITPSLGDSFTIFSNGTDLFII